MVSHVGLRRRAFKVNSLTQVGPARQECDLPDNGDRTTGAHYFQDFRKASPSTPLSPVMLAIVLRVCDGPAPSDCNTARLKTGETVQIHSRHWTWNQAGVLASAHFWGAFKRCPPGYKFILLAIFLL